MKTLNNLLLLVLCLGIANFAMAQDDCGTALPAMPGSNTTGSYTGGGANTTACYTSGATDASWHYFVPTNDGTIDVYSCEEGQDTRVSVYTGSCATLTCVGQNDDSCPQTVGGSNFASEVLGVQVTAGDTVFIEWDDRWGASQHNFTMDYTYCTTSGFNVDVNGFDATATWSSMNTGAYTFAYGPQGATDPLLFTPVSGTSGTMVSGMAAGVYDFYLVDSCFFNGLALGATQVGPITVCVPGYTATGVNTAPLAESFEDCGGAGLSPLWTQSASDDMDWIQRNNNTPSFNTGPSGPNDGNEYIHIETSGVPAGNNAVLESAWMDVTGLSIPAVRFDYHMWGNTMGSLDIEVTADSVWTNVWSLSGNQGNQWGLGSANIAGLGDTIKVRIIGTSGGSYTSDVSVDHFRIEEFCTPVQTAPYFDGFEGGVSCMINDTLDSQDWTIDENGTPSNGTGPSIGADSSQWYAFVETSAPLATGDSAIYNTPWIDISNLTFPELTFAYHMYGFSMGDLRAEVTDDMGATWTEVFFESGDQGDEWHEARINLTVAGVTNDTIRVRFTGVKGPNWGSDMAIDNISIANGLGTDLVVTDILTEYPSCASSGVTASFEVTNFGFNDITNPFEYGVEVNGTLLTQMYTGTIAAGQSVVLTLTNGIDIMPGMNDVSYGFVGADFGDEDDTNDFFEDEAEAADAAMGSGYASSYEGSMDGWFGTGDFEHGVPANTIISSASDGTDAWVTSLDDLYSDDEMSYLYSPCFDFSAFASDPNVEFDIFWDIEDDWDAAWLEVSIDGGNTFMKVGAMGTGTNWYNADVSANNPQFGEGWNGADANNSGGWVTASNRVMGTAGEGSVQFRFVMASDVAIHNEGVAVDNFKILDWCPTDLGLDAVVTMANPGTTGDASAAVTASAGTAPYTYQWDATAGSQTTAIASNLMGNTMYTCVVTDANGCTDSIAVTTMFVSTDFIETMTNFDVFPNPTKDMANVIVEFENAMDLNVEIVNVLGQVMMSDRQEGATKANFGFNVSELTAGVYMVRITANGQQTSQRLVISK